MSSETFYDNRLKSLSEYYNCVDMYFCGKCNMLCRIMIDVHARYCYLPTRMYKYI
jgi:hypothetical protein